MIEFGTRISYISHFMRIGLVMRSFEIGKNAGQPCLQSACMDFSSLATSTHRGNVKCIVLLHIMHDANLKLVSLVGC